MSEQEKITKFNLLPTGGPAINCCELVIYDNDGPEGYYRRVRATRSSDLVKYLMEEMKDCNFDDLNFKITNYHKNN